MTDILMLFESINIAPPTINMIDVGAMALSNPPRWHRLVDQGAATLLGFEPQAEECAKCNAQTGTGYHFLPEALGDGTVRSFYRCNYAPTSSLYKPNRAVIDQYNCLGELMQVVETMEMPTRRLDDIEEARGTDFLKLDIQGAELMVLQNAQDMLRDVSLIQTEVSFLQLYEDQPLFADVDLFLREQGFVFHMFDGFGSRLLLPAADANNPYAGLNQVLWADVVFIRPFDQPATRSDHETLLKRAILFHELCRSYDFAARALHDYDRLTGSSLLHSYSSMMTQQKAA